jgi:hypothetical protein
VSGKKEVHNVQTQKSKIQTQLQRYENKTREREKGRVTMQKYYTPSKLPFFAMAILTILQDYLPFYLLSAKTQNLPLPLSKKPETPQEHPKKYNCPN